MWLNLYGKGAIWEISDIRPVFWMAVLRQSGLYCQHFRENFWRRSMWRYLDSVTWQCWTEQGEKSMISAVGTAIRQYWYKSHSKPLRNDKYPTKQFGLGNRRNEWTRRKCAYIKRIYSQINYFDSRYGSVG